MTGESMQAEPEVSIVLPTYKRAHVLAGAIRSVLRQSFAGLELIVVDDNSPDNTREIVASFGDPRIRYVRNDPNLKLPRALNRGFAMARGAYLTWTSDDNFYGETAIARMVEALRDQRCDFVYADYYVFSDLGPDGAPHGVHHDRLPDRVQLEKGNHIGACFLYSRAVYEAIGDYDPDLFLVEDYDYFMRVAKRFRMCHIAEPLYYFRRHDDALYVSRFCEVKASDVLVRYKNGLLNEREALESVVDLLLRNAGAMKNPLLRWSQQTVKRISYRLTLLHGRLLNRYLRARLRPAVIALLEDYRSKRIPFSAARDRLCALIRESATVAYTGPQAG
jgi:glycosyltransferase involved in cell wall biosynthesis